MNWLLEASIASVLAVSVLIGYLVARKRAGTRFALRRTALVLALLGVGIALVYLRRSHELAVDLLRAGFPLLAAAAEWYLVVTWPQRKRRAGTILEDLGPHPARKTALIVGVSALFGTIAQIGASVSEGALRTRDITLQIFLFSSAITSWFMARSRVYASSKGVLRFDKLIPWSDIESYRWTRGGTLDFLIIRSKRRRLFDREITLEVPVEQRPALERWLAEHSLKPQPVNVE